MVFPLAVKVFPVQVNVAVTASYTWGASILEKLVQMGFVERRGKQLLPTKDGHNLACVLPEVLTSPQLTAQWETELTAIAKGRGRPGGASWLALQK